MKAQLRAIVAVAALGSAAMLGAQEQLGPIPIEQMTDAQKKAYEELVRVRQGEPFPR